METPTEKKSVLSEARNTRNEIINKGDYSELIIYGRNGAYRSTVLIDNDDVQRVGEFTWSILSNGYAGVRRKLKFALLHIFILNREGKEDGLVIDHINRNKLDNRKTNLREVSHRENVINQKISKRNSSGITGVYFDKRRNIWTASFGKNEYLIKKSFKTKEEAIAERNRIDLMVGKPSNIITADERKKIIEEAFKDDNFVQVWLDIKTEEVLANYKKELREKVKKRLKLVESGRDGISPAYINGQRSILNFVLEELGGD